MRPAGIDLGLAGRVVLITGAAGDVGGGILDRFAAAGAVVVPHSRRGQIDDGVRGDLTDATARERVIQEVLDQHGRLDVLVNNAGIQPMGSLLELTEQDVRQVLDVNVVAVFELTRLAAQVMTPGASVVSIASVEAQIPGPDHGHYSASKAALVMHARAAAAELAPRGIRVNTVSPGLVDTDSLAARWPQGRCRWCDAAPLGAPVSPAAVGDACVFLASSMASAITGQDLMVDAGMSVVRPW